MGPYLRLALLKPWWRDVPGESNPTPACLKSSRPCRLLGWLSNEACSWILRGALMGLLRLCWAELGSHCISREGLHSRTSLTVLLW